ncbi:hypothetical protein [Sorangium sp. So ce1182]|uniref:hypothetical protein n=1 Tax=Sorangium sp. So ce1182 TaxID=3133334 RepID=UPI003F63B501
MSESDLFVKCSNRAYAQAILCVIDALREEPRVRTRIGKGHERGPRTRVPSTTSLILESKTDDNKTCWNVEVPRPIHHLLVAASILCRKKDGDSDKWAFSELSVHGYRQGGIFDMFPRVIGFFREYICDIDPNLKIGLLAVERTAGPGRLETTKIQGSSDDFKSVEAARPAKDTETLLRVLENSPDMFTLRVPPTYDNEGTQAFYFLYIPADQWDRSRALLPRAELRGLCASYLEAYLWVLSYQLILAGLHDGSALEYDEFNAARYKLIAARMLLGIATAHLLVKPRSVHVLDALVDVAKMPYESRDARGQVLFAPVDDPSIDWIVRFQAPVALGEGKRMRKLLEMTTGGLYVLSDTYNAYGLCRYSDRVSSPLPVVSMLGAGGSVTIAEFGEAPLLTLRGGEPVLPPSALDLNTLREWLKENCPTVKEPAVRIISEMAAGAARQGYGAAIVVCDDAAQEAERLSMAGFPIVATVLSRESAACVSSIDGAVLVDAKGLCCGIGVILDGVAAQDLGSSARGARYNSIARYVRMRREAGHECAALVISEDGPVELVPEFKPKYVAS